MKKFKKFDIQLFAEDVKQADNEPEEDEPAGLSLEGDGTDAGTQIEEPVDKTKAFSNRLKEKTKEIEDKYEKIYKDKLDSQAKINGYKDWDDMQSSQHKNALIDAGVEDFDKFEGVLKQMISENPDVIEAKEIIERNKKLEQERVIQEEIEKINKFDTSIKSLDDISKLNNCNEIITKLNNGYSLYDAYVLANFDSLKSGFKEAGKTSAINNIDSKSHMKTATGGNSGDINVPQDVMAIYRKNMPNWSEKQIKDHYINSMK